MKLCPACGTQYTDDSMRFCTKDGTTLVDLAPPAQKTAPPPVNTTPPPPVNTTPTPKPFSLDETLSDIPLPPRERGGDEPTVVRQEPQFIPPQEQPRPQPPSQPITQTPPIQTAPPKPTPQQQPKPKSNATLFVVLGVLGLLGLLGIAGAAGAYWYFSSDKKPQEVANANTNSDASNSNSVSSNDNSSDIGSDPTGIDTNANAELGNENTNLNANARPSPSPRPSPSISPSPRANTNRNANANAEETPEQTPEQTPTPRQTPTPASTPQGGRTISGGVVNGKATSLPKPPYPAAARAVRAEGQVNVQVLIDENGNVVSASAISGHPLLRQAAASAARQAKFSPTVLSGQPVKVSGVIIYNFSMNQ